MGKQRSTDGKGRKAAQRVREVMKELCDTPSYRSQRRLNQEAGAKLLSKMRVGTQRPSDFMDEGALWGYVRFKFAKRAVAVHKALTEILGEAHNNPGMCVASIGGGPGNDICGYALWNEDKSADLQKLGEKNNARRLFIFDYADGKSNTCLVSDILFLSPLAAKHSLIKCDRMEANCCKACWCASTKDRVQRMRHAT
jgi:hypothetical protein